MEMVDDEDMATREDFSSWEWLVLNICEVCLTSCTGTVGIASLQELGLLLASSTMCRRISVLQNSLLEAKALPHILVVGILCLRQQLVYKAPKCSCTIQMHDVSSAGCRLHPCWRSSWRGCTSLIQS